MKINIIYGTESGESEFVADDIEAALSDRFDVTVDNMKYVDVEAIDLDALYVVVCSTYGEGDMPSSAQPFHKSLSDLRPELSGLRYAMFGRGDSTYAETYSQGSEHIDRILAELGATRVGEYGREDAGDWDTPEDVAVQWAEGVVEVLVSENEGAMS